MIPAKEIDGELWIRAADARIKEAAELSLQMDLRDYFAAKVMQALLTSIESGKEHQAALVPSTAYDIADAMLKEREK
jgi:hypothetical protein